MKNCLKKRIAAVLAFCLAVSLCGCGSLSLTEEDITELEGEEEVQVVVGQTIGEELAPTYAADHIFSLNCVSDASYNPYNTNSAWNRVVSMLVYESLVVLDESFSAQPNLITAWETTDGRNWTFYVDTSRTFHDGSPLTAMDASYSLQIAMNYTSPYTVRFRNVLGVSYLDQESFAVTLSESNYRFYELLDIPCVEYNTGYWDRPNGTGPYAFSESGRYLTRYKNHPKAAEMPLETIHLKEYSSAVDILQAFEDSYIDLVINDPTGLSSLGYSSANIIKYVNTSNLHYIGYNSYSRVFSQSMYRSIVTYAIDRATIVSEVMKGAATATTVPIAPQSYLYPAQVAATMEYSPEGMETALNNVGLTDADMDGFLEVGGTLTTIDFIVCSDTGTKVAAARSITSSLRSFGFDVHLRELSYSDYLSELGKGNYDMYYAEVKLGPDWDLRPLLGMGQDLNYGDIRDTTLESHMTQVMSTEGDELISSMQEMYIYIGQNAFITPICFEKSEVLYHRGVLSGLSPTQDNVFYGMENWTVDLS